MKGYAKKKIKKLKVIDWCECVSSETSVYCYASTVIPWVLVLLSWGNVTWSWLLGVHPLMLDCVQQVFWIK